MKKIKPQKKHTLLKGEGVHQHTLYGNFEILKEDNFFGFTKLSITKDSVLKHEHPNGSFGEHQSLKVSKGEWVMGKQVEYNPFTNGVTSIWD